jgi:hypothetical protein
LKIFTSQNKVHVPRKFGSQVQIFSCLKILTWTNYSIDYLLGRERKLKVQLIRSPSPDMDLQVVSFNVRGLSTARAQTQPNSYLRMLHFNVLFLQEHKLRSSDWQFIGKRIWSGGEFYVSAAANGLHAARNDAVTSGRGGLAIAVAHQLQPFVTNHFVSPCGWAIYLHLDGLPFGSLGLLNIHGPNEEADRAALWFSLAHLVDPSRP